MSIKENSVVKVVTDNPFFAGLIGTGEVVRTYSDLGIAIVRFESGQIVKIPVDCLAEVEQKNENQEPKIQEGAKRITKDEFIAAVHEVTSPGNLLGGFAIESNPLGGLLGGVSAMITGMKIADEIFKDQDVVTMTEDQLIGALCDGCNPVKLSKGTKKNMSVAHCMPVAMLSISALESLIKIFFGDGSENA